MHEPVKVERKTFEEMVLIKEDYMVLKKQIEDLYNTLVSLETIRLKELNDDIEEI